MPTNPLQLAFTSFEPVVQYLILRDVSRVPNVIGNSSAGIERVFTWMETGIHAYTDAPKTHADLDDRRGRCTWFKSGLGWFFRWEHFRCFRQYHGDDDRDERRLSTRGSQLSTKLTLCFSISFVANRLVKLQFNFWYRLHIRRYYDNEARFNEKCLSQKIHYFKLYLNY